jgi:hypothetical protein
VTTSNNELETNKYLLNKKIREIHLRDVNE